MHQLRKYTKQDFAHAPSQILARKWKPAQPEANLGLTQRHLREERADRETPWTVLRPS